MATTAADIIQGALLNINSYSPGEPLAAYDATVGLNALNDLLDSLSNDEAFVYTQSETIFPWIGNQYQYSVGNPVGGTFSGNLTSGTPFITNVTSMPSQLVVGATLTDSTAGGAAVIPAGSSLFPVGTTVVAIFATSVQMSANATGTPSGLDVITYTVPGISRWAGLYDFAQGFTRTNTSGNSSLDYTSTLPILTTTSASF